jgi:HPt (histidine-containing phosphotransfer) domain-containing protein
VSDDPRARVAAALEEMRAEYRRDLPPQVARLAAAAARASTDPAALRQAEADAHRIRGTAGSYGLTAVSEAASRLEDALARGARGEAVWERVASAVAELQALANG